MRVAVGIIRVPQHGAVVAQVKKEQVREAILRSAGELHQPRSDDRGIHFIEKLQLGREVHIQVGHRCAGRTGDLRHWAVDKAFCPEKLV